MTDQQILAATGNALSRMAGEVLQPDGPWPHDLEQYGTEVVCGKCGERASTMSIFSMDDISEHKCEVNLIPLDWNVVMKWRDWAVENCGPVEFEQALIEALYSSKIKPADCVGAKAQPAHYLQAAMLCKERSKP